jgi:quinol monooxygenase YgiN
MIVGTLTLQPAPERHDDVLEVLRSIQGPVLAQPGCAAFRIYEEQGPDRAVVLVEQWDSEETLDAHLRSEAYRRILAAIELSGSPPEIRFDYVSASEGMELIERSRNRPSGTPERA